MKGVVLAGGRGLRLYPLTKVTNKHLLPVGNEPMIFNPIKKLKEAGINDILIITSTEHMGSIVNLLASGEELGVNLTYKVQERSLGIAHALGLAKEFTGNDKIIVVLGDNITTGSIKQFVDNFSSQKKGSRVILKKVKDPSRYGIVAIDEKQIIEIEEKPNKPKSSYAVIGYYMYGPEVFEIIKGLKPSTRGEYEITDVNNEYIKRGELEYDILEADWTDAGTFGSLLYANKMFMKKSDTGGVSKIQVEEMIKAAENKLKELKKHL